MWLPKTVLKVREDLQVPSVKKVPAVRRETKAIREIPAHKVRKVLVARKVHKVQVVLQVRKVRRDLVAKWDLKDPADQLDRKVLPDPPDPPDRRDHKVPKVPKVLVAL